MSSVYQNLRMAGIKSQLQSVTNQPNIEQFDDLNADIRVPRDCTVSSIEFTFAKELVNGNKDFLINEFKAGGWSNETVFGDDPDDTEDGPSGAAKETSTPDTQRAPTVGSSYGAGPAASSLKRPREEAPEAARVSKMQEMLGAQATTPNILEGKPLDVKLYTQHLLNVYESSRKYQTAVTRLAGNFISFEGELSELSEVAYSGSPLAPLMRQDHTRTPVCWEDLRVSVFSSLNECRLRAASLREHVLTCQRTFWLANHTQGCDWNTVQQLEFRQQHDESRMRAARR